MSISLSRVGDAMLARRRSDTARSPSYEESLAVRRHLAEIDDNTVQRQAGYLARSSRRSATSDAAMGDNQGGARGL